MPDPMTVRDALEQLAAAHNKFSTTGRITHISVKGLAPIVEKALDETARKMSAIAGIALPITALEEAKAAGIAVLTEKEK